MNLTVTSSLPQYPHASAKMQRSNYAHFAPGVMNQVIFYLEPRDILLSYRLTCRSWNAHTKRMIRQYPLPFILKLIQKVQDFINITIKRKNLLISFQEPSTFPNAREELYGNIPTRLSHLHRELAASTLKPKALHRSCKALIDMLSEDQTPTRQLLDTRPILPTLDLLGIKKNFLIRQLFFATKALPLGEWHFLFNQTLLKYFTKLIKNVCDFPVKSKEDQYKKNLFLFDIAEYCLKHKLSILLVIKAKQAISNLHLQQYLDVKSLIYASRFQGALDQAQGINEPRIRTTAVDEAATAWASHDIQQRDYLHAFSLLRFLEDYEDMLEMIISDITKQFGHEFALKYIESHVAHPNIRLMAIQQLMYEAYQAHLPEIAIHLALQFSHLDDRNHALISVIQFLTSNSETEENVAFAVILTNLLPKNLQQQSYELLVISLIRLNNLVMANHFLSFIEDKPLKARLEQKSKTQEEYLHRIGKKVRAHLKAGNVKKALEYLQKEKILNIRSLISNLIIDYMKWQGNFVKLFELYPFLNSETIQFLRHQYIKHLLPELGCIAALNFIKETIPPSQQQAAKAVIIDYLIRVDFRSQESVIQAIDLAILFPLDCPQRQGSLILIIRHFLHIKDWVKTAQLLPLITDEHFMDTNMKQVIVGMFS